MKSTPVDAESLVLYAATASLISLASGIYIFGHDLDLGSTRSMFSRLVSNLQFDASERLLYLP
jgi:hypothetical protein